MLNRKGCETAGVKHVTVSSLPKMMDTKKSPSIEFENLHLGE
jgi:hypothetical protein